MNENIAVCKPVAEKSKRIENFYGAKDCALTKTMTKEISFPDMEAKL